MGDRWRKSLRRRRKALGLHQDQLGAALGMAGRLISQLERGERPADQAMRARIDARLAELEGHEGAQRAALADAATRWLNARMGTHYQPTSDDAQRAARLWQLWGWSEDRVLQVLEAAARRLEAQDGGTQYIRPATLYQERRMRRVAEELDAGVRHDQVATSRPRGHGAGRPDDWVSSADLFAIADEMDRIIAAERATQEDDDAAVTGSH